MSQPSLKLTMIGPSGTGKSCYLYATYFRMLEGVAGFNFNCVNVNQALALEEAWNAILDDGVWPAGTGEGGEEFRFSCKHNGGQIGDFTWLDYRGGLLNETASEGSDLTHFLNRAVDSDAILVCLPADVLLTAQANDLRVQRRWARMKNEILRILGAIYRRNDAASLVFMITKSDLCKSQEEGRLCVEAIRTAFQQYFTGTPEYAMITASRLGRFEGGTDDFQQGAEIKGVLDPHNVHLPILLPFWVNACRAKMELNGAQAEYARENANFNWASTLKERGEKLDSAGDKINCGAILLLFLGGVVGVGLQNRTWLILWMLLLFAGAIWANILGYKGQKLKDAAPSDYDLGKMRRQLEGKAERVRVLYAAAAIPTDAIWRELNGRVELYRNGKKILSAAGSSQDAPSVPTSNRETSFVRMLGAATKLFGKHTSVGANSIRN